jgi:hypothetical protein
VAGGEAIQALPDVCRLEHDEDVAVTQWAAHAILTAGLQTTLQKPQPVMPGRPKAMPRGVAGRGPMADGRAQA